jgi:hypothetical protein
VNRKEVATQVITKSAFVQARKKLSADAFLDLNKLVIDNFYPNATINKWKGFRVCAVDGSQLRLPNEHGIVDEFGSHRGKNSRQACPMALASVYYDVLNQIVIDASINPSKSSERECAFQHLKHAEQNDLVLFDRGYPAFWLYAALAQKKLSFCMRVKSNLEHTFRDFANSGQSQAIIEIKPNKTSIIQCANKGLPSKPIRLRLIRVNLKKETEILITNLLDEERYPIKIFKGLYHLRWGVEENYKRQKQWTEIENFSGKSALSVKQDFYARIVTLNITAIMIYESQRYVDEKNAHRRYRYKINFAQALSKMKDAVVLLILKVDFKERLTKLLVYLSKTVEAVRVGRSFKRVVSNKNNNIKHLCYKRCR